MMFDWIHVGAAVPAITVANPQKNTEEICRLIRRAKDPALLVFPELCVTGYTCGDLFFQTALQEAVQESIFRIAKETEDRPGIVIAGAPLLINGQLYNCALPLCQGRLLGVVPKTFLPNYNEFYEQRWFCAASDLAQTELSPQALGLAQEGTVPVGNDLIFDAGVFRFGIELCEDLWTPLSPGTMLALGGAEIIVNLSASNEVISKRDYRRSLVQQHSAQNLCTYVFSSAGDGESTSDLTFSGHGMIAENGSLLAESAPDERSGYLLCADTDLGKLRTDRQKMKTFAQTARLYGAPCRTVPAPQQATSDGHSYPLRRHPFVPSAAADRRSRCRDIFRMQTAGLSKRLAITGGKMVLGISGGLDSTLALLVCAQTAKEMGLPASSVCGVTMPCFGTTDRTYQNALQLMQALGVTVMEVPIQKAVQQHFSDIGHDPSVQDVTYENSQARERTQVLMDVANRLGAIVIGTGDLSELALGWCTYNGDHMSMYGVNVSIPKTLVQWMIESVIDQELFPSAAPILQDVLDTPISPELLPPQPDGEIAQKTEDLVGPYPLHDFFLYYMLRFGFSPAKIYTMACRAFENEYSQTTVLHWLNVFYRRFFSQQFKRNCMPDGVKVGSVCLSPRGDWRMPSDASAAVWLKELERLRPKN